MDVTAIEQRIVTACQNVLELDNEASRLVAFHMTDWLKELERLHTFYGSPDVMNDSQVAGIVVAFLIHAPNHVAAAAKLATGIGVTDIFGVGATESEDE